MTPPIEPVGESPKLDAYIVITRELCSCVTMCYDKCALCDEHGHIQVTNWRKTAEKIMRSLALKDAELEAMREKLSEAQAGIATEILHCKFLREELDAVVLERNAAIRENEGRA